MSERTCSQKDLSTIRNMLVYIANELEELGQPFAADCCRVAKCSTIKTAGVPKRRAKRSKRAPG